MRNKIQQTGRRKISPDPVAGHVRKTKNVAKLVPHPPRDALDPDLLCNAHVKGQ